MFLITEFGFSGSLGNRDHQRFIADALYTSELGIMRNLTRRLAVGLTPFITLAFYDDRGIIYGRGGIRPRFRFWLGGDIALDLAPGIVVYAGEGFLETPPFSGLAAISIGDWVTITGQVEFVKWDDTVYDWTVDDYVRVRGDSVCGYAGIRFGSYAGAAASAGVLLISSVSSLF
jgi:hypothetical protein